MHNNWMNGRYKGKPYVPTPVEHLANIITHGLMVPVSAVAGMNLIDKASTRTLYTIAFLYGTNLTLLFAISAAFHAVFYLNEDVWLINLLRKADRAIIYVFIAACYSPWLTLAPLTGDELCFRLHVIMWILALTGVLFEITCSKRYPFFGIICYVVYGVLPAVYLNYQMNFPGISELKLSGASYLIGVLFFRCDGIIPFAHAIWHCCVIFGASVHYYAVLEHFYSGATLEMNTKLRSEL